MLYVYDQRFNVTDNLENFCELNKALIFNVSSSVSLVTR